MKSYSPRRLSIVTAAFITALIAIVLYSVVFFNAYNRWIVWITIFALLFLTIYFILLYVIKNFIYDKIRVIYKTLYSIKSSGKQFPHLDLNKDIIAEVNEQVSNWQIDHNRELEDLKRLEQYRREFLGNVSHELKTPIFNIQGYILTLIEGGLEDKNINLNYLKRAEKSVDRMITIVEDLQTISQLEAGELEIDFETFNITELANDVIHAQEMASNNKNIVLKVLDNNKNVMVSADRFRIRQVLTNLVVNSIKYGREGGETEIRFFDMDENILVEVADNGIGIEQKHLSRLFERFYRVDKHRSREQGGSGLGLAIVKHIIEAHNQVINVRSTEGIGSTFSFTLKKAAK